MEVAAAAAALLTRSDAVAAAFSTRLDAVAAASPTRHDVAAAVAAVSPSGSDAAAAAADVVAAAALPPRFAAVAALENELGSEGDAARLELQRLLAVAVGWELDAKWN